MLFIIFLKINHDIHHFKLSITERDLLASLGNKANIISSLAFEHEFYTKKLKYSPEKIHNLSLLGYGRFRYIYIK